MVSRRLDGRRLDEALAGQGHRRQAAALASAPRPHQYPEQASDEVTAVKTGAGHEGAGPWARVVARRFDRPAGSVSSAFSSALAPCSFFAAAVSAGNVFAASNSRSASSRSLIRRARRSMALANATPSPKPASAVSERKAANSCPPPIATASSAELPVM